MQRKYIEEDLIVMESIEKCIKESQNPLSSTITYSGNTTVINYNHLFQYAKLNIESFTVKVNTSDVK